jgi:hypothetical protein
MTEKPEELRKLFEQATLPMRCSLAWAGCDTNLDMAKEFVKEGMFEQAESILKGFTPKFRKSAFERIEKTCNVSLSSAKDALEKAMNAIKDKKLAEAQSALQETRKELAAPMTKILGEEE